MAIANEEAAREVIYQAITDNLLGEVIFFENLTDDKTQLPEKFMHVTTQILSTKNLTVGSPGRVQYNGKITIKAVNKIGVGVKEILSNKAILIENMCYNNISGVNFTDFLGGFQGENKEESRYESEFFIYYYFIV